MKKFNNNYLQTKYNYSNLTFLLILLFNIIFLFNIILNSYYYNNVEHNLLIQINI